MQERILVYGAGVIGSIFAGKLMKSGYAVTVLARGKRYDEITAQGLLLKNILTDKIESYKINCIRELDKDDEFEYILVAVQNNQIDAILPILAENKSKNMVFIVNNPLGYEKYGAFVGKERVMLGFPSAGGERKDGVVSCFIGTGLARIMQTTTFGEADGSKSQRLTKLVRMFKRSGFEPAESKNMDAWQKTHIAFVVPIANALYQFESDNYRLAKSAKTVKKMILAIREGFQALKDTGIGIEPVKLHYYYLPLWLLTPLFQIVLRTRIAEYAMAKHTIAAKEEITVLEKQFLGLFKESEFKNWKELQLPPADFSVKKIRSPLFFRFPCFLRAAAGLCGVPAIASIPAVQGRAQTALARPAPPIPAAGCFLSRRM